MALRIELLPISKKRYFFSISNGIDDEIEYLGMLNSTLEINRIQYTSV